MAISLTMPATQHHAGKGWRMKLSRALAMWVTELRLTKSKLTVAGYESDVHRLIAMAQQDSILHFDADLVRRYFVMLSAGGAQPSTLHRKRAALSEFSKWGRRQRLWTDDPLETLPRIPKPKTLPRPFTGEEMARLLALELPPMERVLRALLVATGLRVTPICSLKVGDISREPARLRVLVKGGKTQVVPLHPELAELLVSHVLTYTDLTGHAPLLAQKLRKGEPPRPLNRKLVERICARWGARGNVSDCTPHRFRHSFATSLLRQGVDIRLIKEALGHADIASTMLYTEVTVDDVAGAINRLPFRL